MSILGQATQPLDAGWGSLLVFAPPAVVSVVIAALTGVFRRRSIVGPPRVADGESLGPVLLILGGGFVLWIMLQVLCLAPVRPTSPAPAPSTLPAATNVSAEPASRPTSPPGIDVPPGKMALASTVPSIVAGAMMVLATIMLRPGGLGRLGFSGRQLGRGIVLGLIGSVIVVPLVFLAAQVTELVWEGLHYAHPKEHDLLRFMGDSHNLWLTVVLIGSAVVVAPVFEELLFRGHLQTLVTHALARLSGGKHRVDPGRGFEIVVPGDSPETRATPEMPPPPVPSAAARWASIFLTSLIFASVHPAWTVPPIFFLSICLGYAYERTGNLWTTMTIHAMFNTTSTILYFAVLR
jgi:membrane protease YdiL (CAAX protease family)